MVRRWLDMPEVAGSTPAPGTTGRHVPRGRLALAGPVRRVRFSSSPLHFTGSHVPRGRPGLASQVWSVRFRLSPFLTPEGPCWEGYRCHMPIAVGSSPTSGITSAAEGNR